MENTMDWIEGHTIALLRCAMTGEKPDGNLPDGAGRALYRFADSHDLAHCLTYVLESASALPENPVGELFRKKQIEAIWRTEQQEYVREQIGALLEGAGIEHIFLKGSVLRRLYPQPWLRTGVDVDVLVRKEKQDAAIRLLCQRLGCALGLRTPHDAKLAFPSGQNAEIHVQLSGTESAQTVLADAWNTAVPVEGKQWELALAPELTYVYHIAHMAKHFEQGGCGIRPLMDLWIMERRMPRDQAAVNELLERARLRTFAETAERLKDSWFSGAEGDALSRRMGEYILGGGAYGSMEKRVAVDRAKSGSRAKNLLSRAFLPYDTMAEIYPPLKGHRWLLTYYQLCRWCRLLFRGSAGSVMAELRSNRSISEEKIRMTETLLKDLELL